MLLGGLSGFAYAEGDQSHPAVSTEVTVVTRPDDALPRANIDAAPAKHVRTAPVVRTAAPQHPISHKLIVPVAAAATRPSCNNIICGNFVLVGIGF